MACPADDELLAMLERSTDPAKFGELELHIDSCASCRKAVAALALGSRSPSGAGEHRPFAGVDAELGHELAMGAVIGERYEVRRELGRGGMGTVYLARDRVLGRDVALKLHRSGSSARLQREASAMAKLAHPNVVGVFEVAQIDDRIYVAMEYVRGATLRGWVAATPRAWREVVAMLVATGRGLAAAHAGGLVHRDFKPENVLVGDDGRPRVSDFGLARTDTAAAAPVSIDDAVAADTQTGGIAGTPAYMAPEQLGGEPVDARGDQFAFCVVAWECLYGRRPFPGPTLAALADAIHAQRFSPLPKSAQNRVPERVRAVLARGLAVAPDDRYADVPALLAALEHAAAPRTARYAVFAALAALVLGTGGVAGAKLYAAHHRAEACANAEAAMTARFGAARHAQLAAALVGTGSPFAQGALAHAAPVFDRVAGGLAGEAGAVCRDDALPAREAAARTACLARRAAELDATLDDLTAHVAAADVQRAPEAAWSLYDPARCAEPTLAAGDAMSIDAAKRLGAIQALEATGRYPAALPLAKQLYADVRAAHDPAGEVAVALVLGGLQDEVEPAAAPATYQAALAAAEAHGRDLDAARALGALAIDAGTVGHDHAEAHRQLDLARAKLARIGGNAATEAQLAMAEAQVLVDENRLGDADRAMRASLAASEQLYGDDYPKVGMGFGTLSQVLRGERDAAGQLEYARRALEILQAAYGDTHPLVAVATANLGAALMANNDLDGARTALLAGAALMAKIYGPDDPMIVATWGNLGDVELRAQRWAAAKTDFEHAKAAAIRAGGPDAAAVAGVDRDLGDALASLGQLDDAQKVDEEAVAIYASKGADGEPWLGGALTDLCEVYLTRGRADLALPAARRAVALIQKLPADGDPQDLADARFALARALWDTKTDRAQARSLAAAAAELAVAPERKQLVTTWLAAHR